MNAEQLAHRIESSVTEDRKSSDVGRTYQLVQQVMQENGTKAGTEVTRAATQTLIEDGILPNISIGTYMTSDATAEASEALSGNCFEQNASSVLATQIEIQRRSVQSVRDRS